MKRNTIALLAFSAVAAALFSATPAEEGKQWWRQVQTLADDRFEGRDTGSPGHLAAARYVADQFRAAGLEPAGTDGYLQPVKFEVRRLDEPNSSLELVRNGKAEKLKLGEDAILGVRYDPAPEVEAAVYFAGYGAVIPEKKVDEFAGLDLRGKVIVTMYGAPAGIPGPLRAHYSSSSERARVLRRAGVAGVVLLMPPSQMEVPWERVAGSRFMPSMNLADRDLRDESGVKVGMFVNPARAERWFAGSGHTAAELFALADAGKPLPHFALPYRLHARTSVVRSQVESQNVAGILRGSDPALAREYVALTAHLDHVGTGEPVNGDRIYNGAMDDASGVATLIEIARQAGQSKPKRSLLLVAVTAEEKGLLGSRYFAAHPTVPVGEIVADLNVDMFLPLYPLHRVTVYGLNESDLGDDVRRVAGRLGISVQEDPEPQRNVFVRSDQYSFIRRGIPSLMVDIGFEKGTPEEKIHNAWLQQRYHAPSDDPQQPVDLESAGRFNRLVDALIREVANRPTRPQWRPESFFRRFATPPANQ